MLNMFKAQPKNNEFLNDAMMEDSLTGLKNRIAPSVYKEGSTFIQLGENFVRTLAVIDYPTEPEDNWLSRLYRFKGNVTISFHLEPKTSEKMSKGISKSIRELNSRLNPVKGKPSADLEMDLKNKIDSAKTVLKKLKSGDQNTIYNVHMYIHIVAQSKKEMEDLTQKVMGVIWAINLKTSAPFDRMKYAFNSVLPLMSNELPEWTYQNMDCSAASSIFPFDESEIFEETGIIKGINITTGSLVLINQHKLKNHNEFIIGMSGAGKSFYMKKDMMRYFAQGTKIFILDPEGEYSKLVKKLGGQVIKMSSMSKIIINPFEILHGNMDILITEDLDENGDPTSKVKIVKSLLNQKIVRLKTFFKLIKKDLTPLEGALIEDFLIQIYEDKGITWDTDFSELDSESYPVMGDLYDKIEKADEDRLRDFLAILKTYVHGSNSLMFNGTTNVNLKADIVSFDLKELEEESESQAAAMYNVLSYLWDVITEDTSIWKRLYVDEAHILADPDNPRAMKFLFNIFKRIRKYTGGCTAATQQLADYLSAVEGKRNYGKAIIGNSQSKLFLSMEPSDVNDIEKYGIAKLSQKERYILQSDKRGEGIFIAGRRRVHVEVDYTPFEMEAIDPRRYVELFGNESYENEAYENRRIEVIA
ncbi:DUF87 domain-containing protein [Priestia aryabhattai]|uniref:VirB4 family type IV secretion system protein n=1 Tax=Priestia aryabhattai TaxID=412384 RepID=UPI001C8D603F|nr:DUF87 domain-containing protein [Priestia aryabhattai]MBY0077951.1 DUF87 domain-containing protein [Priestia aryabhattai]